MGIDIYMSWPNQKDEEKKAQATGFSVVHGHVGYLREAYHGGPYVTHYLVSEAFDSDTCEAKIPASVMRERLPEAKFRFYERMLKVYPSESEKERERAWKAFEDFVALAETKEKETGEPVTIYASY